VQRLTIRISTEADYAQLRRNDAGAGPFAGIDTPTRPG
jgi:hypothetical protein